MVMSVAAAAILPTNRQDNKSLVLPNNTPKPDDRKPYKPEGSKKRQHSSGSTPSPSISSKEDKRLRQDSTEFDYDNVELADDKMEPDPTPDPTLADIMRILKLTAKVSDLENLCKKEDLLKIQSTVSSQALEIQQLREDISTQGKR